MKLFKILATGTLIMAGLVTSAQEDASNADSMAPSFGIKGGVNFATLNGDDIDSPDSRTSFHVGLVGEFPLSSMVSIQTEALYSGQGAQANFSGWDGDKAELQLDYINVPVLAKFYLMEGLSIEAGPQFSFLVHDEFDLNPNSDDGDIDPGDFGFNPETFEFGVAGGLTFHTAMGLFATARYTQGVTKISKDWDVQNSVFQLGVGFKF